MITASKAFIAFCLLALVGTVLVIGPTELRRLLAGGTKTEIAAATKPEVRLEPKAEAKVEAKVEAKPAAKPDEPKLAATAPPTPKADAMAETQKQVTALADLVPAKPPAAAGA